LHRFRTAFLLYGPCPPGRRGKPIRGDPAGRFGSGAVTVTQDPANGITFQVALQDQQVGFQDSHTSSAAARGAVTYINTVLTMSFLGR